MSGLSNCIVYVTAFILLVDKIQGERLDFMYEFHTYKNSGALKKYIFDLEIQGQGHTYMHTYIITHIHTYIHS